MLVAGASGRLGAAVLEACAPGAGGAAAGTAITAMGRDSTEMNITERGAVRAALRDARPDVVVNCAAYTDVDAAETDGNSAAAVNALGAGELAAACTEAGAALVHVSTDYVFGGDRGPGDGPYEPSDAPDPRTAYGRTKLDGERRVRAAHPGALIVRTAWLYTGAPSTAGGGDFVATMLRLERERDEVRVVDDQRGSPTYIPDLAAGLVEAAAALGGRSAAPARPGRSGTRPPSGAILHATGAGDATWFELAREVFRAIGADPGRVRPCSTADMPRPAPRPAYSVLSGAAWAQAGLHPLRPWRAALADALR